VLLSDTGNCAGDILALALVEALGPERDASERERVRASEGSWVGATPRRAGGAGGRKKRRPA
jgi:hypothetical protein